MPLQRTKTSRRDLLKRTGRALGGVTTGLALTAGDAGGAPNRQPARQVLIRNNTDWRDIDGNLINAHEGGVARFDDRFYWYGTTFVNNPKAINGFVNLKPEPIWEGFSVYSSDDLVHWKHEGKALPPPKWGFCTLYTAHRAHVIYNEKTRKYVMWFFYYLKYPAVPLMVAVADKPTGPFEILGIRETGGPYGFGQDMGLFKDDDGSAYLVYDDGTRDIRIDRLSDDYLSSTKQSVVALKRIHEAPAMVKYKGKYIVAGSGVVGWDVSETHYAVASSPMGPYGEKKCMSEKKTWASQLTDLVYVRESNLVLAMGDMWWNPDRNDWNKSRYLWIPVVFDPETETARMDYRAQWNPFEPIAS